MTFSARSLTALFACTLLAGVAGCGGSDTSPAAEPAAGGTTAAGAQPTTAGPAVAAGWAVPATLGARVFIPEEQLKAAADAHKSMNYYCSGVGDGAIDAKDSGKPIYESFTAREARLASDPGLNDGLNVTVKVQAAVYASGWPEFVAGTGKPDCVVLLHSALTGPDAKASLKQRKDFFLKTAAPVTGHAGVTCGSTQQPERTDAFRGCDLFRGNEHFRTVIYGDWTRTDAAGPEMAEVLEAVAKG